MLHTPSSRYMYLICPQNIWIWVYPTPKLFPVLALAYEWTKHDPPPHKKSHLVATHTPLPTPAKKEEIKKITKWKHAHWFGWWKGGYIQKFQSTVLVPPQLYISSTHLTAHTHARNIVYPFTKVFLSYLNLIESLKWPNIPIQWQTPPPTPTLTIMILFKASLISKSGWTSTKELIKYLFESTTQRIGRGSKPQPLELAN